MAAAVIFALSASIYVECLHVPQYQASMTYVVTSRRTSYTNSSNLSVTKTVASIMTEMLNENLVLNQVRAEPEELSQFGGTIQATQVENTNLINVIARADSPEAAFQALLALEAVFPEIADLVSSSATAQVARRPIVSGVPVNGINERDLMMKAGVVGAVLMVVFLCWINISRETIQTRDGARHRLDANVITMVNHERKHRTLKQLLRRRKKSLQVFSPTISYAYAEQINVICTRLEQERAANDRKITMVTGVGENEGKSTIAANVAAMLAMKGKRVALVDADLRKPAMNKFFDGVYQSEMPLNQLLANSFNRDDFLKCMVKHEKLKLFMFFCDRAETKQVRLLTGETMKQMLQAMRAFDYVIIDTPPMGFFADSEALADLVDSTIMVVRQDYTSAWDLNDAADTLKNAKSEFLGCVLNDMAGHSLAGYGYGYGYGYGRRYGYGEKTKTSRKQKS